MRAANSFQPSAAAAAGRRVDALLARTVVSLRNAPDGHEGLCSLTLATELADRTPLSVCVLLRGLPHR